ncbi:MAG: phenylacetic acid degradation operon negative regulatory protein PaaX [Candidatus Eremiobacteraeota bacterium]|nr:phenylacetic acid degradation operon negative regulatory protein PaaX [Candidatus Eremiobacteraeota bacterium]
MIETKADPVKAELDARVVTRPNSFIFTLYADFALGHGDEIPMRSLLTLMAEFGLSEQAVRQAVSRMSKQGWLRARRTGARSFYALTARGIRRIKTIGPRVYEPAEEWDGRWRLLTYTVSETIRESRDRLRKDLRVLGFAPLCASTWISPREASGAAREAANAAGLGSRIDLFTAEYRGPMGDHELLRKCWNVDAIAQAYGEFIERYQSRVRFERKAATLSNEAAFVERLWLVHDFRRFAYIDPGLPSVLLPAHWAGSIASSLFRQYYQIISSRATQFYNRALADAGKA